MITARLTAARRAFTARARGLAGIPLSEIAGRAIFPPAPQGAPFVSSRILSGGRDSHVPHFVNSWH